MKGQEDKIRSEIQAKQAQLLHDKRQIFTKKLLQAKREKLFKAFKEALNGEGPIIELAAKINNSDPDEPSFLEDILKSNTLELLVNFLEEKNYQSENTMLKVSTALNNIALEKEKGIPRLVDLGIIKKAVRLTRHKCFEISGTAFSILGNIAGASLKFRNQILNEQTENIHQSLLSRNNKKGSKESFEEDLTWCLSVFFRDPIHPVLSMLAYFIPIIQNILLEERAEGINEEIIKSCLLCLRNFTEGNEGAFKSILKESLMRFLINLLSVSKDWKAVNLTLGIIEDVFHEYSAFLLEYGIISKLPSLLKHPKREVRKKTAFLIPYMIVENKPFIDAIFGFEKGAIVERLCEMAQQEDTEIAEECTICLTILCRSGAFEQTRELVSRGIVNTLIASLKTSPNETLLYNCLMTLNNILIKYSMNEAVMEVLQKLKSCEGYRVVEGFKESPSDAVSHIATHISTKYLQDK